MPKRLSVIMVVVLVLILAEELLLPRTVGGLVARGMVDATGTDQVVAEVAGRPAFLMLGGRFDDIRILAQNAQIDKIKFAELDATLRNVELDMGTLISRRTIVVKTVRDIDLTAVITREELTRYLNQSVKGIKNATVTMNGGKVQVSANLILGQLASLAVTLDGKVVGDGQKIKFVTDRFLLNNTVIGNIGGTVLTEIPLADLKKLPFGVEVRSITSENDKITIHADNRAK